VSRSPIEEYVVDLIDARLVAKRHKFFRESMYSLTTKCIDCGLEISATARYVGVGGEPCPGPTNQ
jgi:hypothetical protein